MSRMLSPTELRRRNTSPLWESNPPPLPYHGSALPNELRGRNALPLNNPLSYRNSSNRLLTYFLHLVGREGFEPTKAITGRFTVCSLWPLGYRPICQAYLVDLQIAEIAKMRILMDPGHSIHLHNMVSDFVHVYKGSKTN
jgi:hypothetical protein